MIFRRWTPDADDVFSNYLPRIAFAIGFAPNRTSTDENGLIIEGYERFTDDDYSVWSAYLQNEDCSVIDYNGDNYEITITLSKNNQQFGFIYDRAQSRATVTYPADAILAPISNLQARTAEAKEYTTSNYVNEAEEGRLSGDECERMAMEAFRNRAWRVPSSLQIHSHSRSYNEQEKIWTISIDYSAENGFGGTNREICIITVDPYTGRIRIY